MPPKKASNDTTSGMPMSLRFKYGIHTFFILVEPTDPFSAITKELIEALHDRAVPILATDTELVPKWNSVTNAPETDENGDPVEEWLPTDPIPVPSKDDDLQIEYAVRADIHDLSKGWKDLNIQPDDTPLGRGLKNNDELAFVVRKPEDASNPPEFQVKQPIWEGEAEEEEEEEQEAVPTSKSSKSKGKGKKKVVNSSDVDMDQDEEL